MEETLLKSYKLSYRSIPAAGIHGVGLRNLPGNLQQLSKGWQEAKSILKQFEPHVMFFTGGYLGVPVALAGRNIPSVVFVPDIEPGLALKTILRTASKIAVNCRNTLRYLPGKNALVTGYPIRQEMRQWKREPSRKHFGIAEKDNVLLVFGGSKGARSINQALINTLPGLLKEMHVIHISGKDNWQEVQQATGSLDQQSAGRYHLYPFLNEDMGAAFAAADLVVCRAGASTLGELPFFGLPAILVPYPYAWRYQQQNAAYLTKNGGAVVLEDSCLESQLKTTITKLIHDRQRLQDMRQAMERISPPNAAQQIGELIISVGKAAETKGGVGW